MEFTYAVFITIVVVGFLAINNQFQFSWKHILHTKKNNIATKLKVKDKATTTTKIYKKKNFFRTSLEKEK